MVSHSMVQITFWYLKLNFIFIGICSIYGIFFIALKKGWITAGSGSEHFDIPQLVK